MSARSVAAPGSTMRRIRRGRPQVAAQPGGRGFPGGSTGRDGAGPVPAGGGASVGMAAGGGGGIGGGGKLMGEDGGGVATSVGRTVGCARGGLCSVMGAVDPVA